MRFAAASVAALSFISRVSLAQTPIANLYPTGSGAYTVSGTVTGIVGGTASVSDFVLMDNTGSVFAYSIPTSLYGATPAVGDNITLTATDSPYGNAPELKTATAVTVNSTGNAVSIPVVSIPTLNSAGNTSTMQAIAPYAESIVTVDNVYLSASSAPPGTPVTSLATTATTTYYLSDLPAEAGNIATLYDYKSYSAVVAAATAANAMEASNPSFYSGPLDITGFVNVYNGQAELEPLSITAGTVAAAPEPTSLALLGLAALPILAKRRRAE